MKCTNCIHNEVCKYKTDYKGIKNMREEAIANYDGWDMYRVEVNCEEYKPDEEVLWQEELERQLNNQVEEVF